VNDRASPGPPGTIPSARNRLTIRIGIVAIGASLVGGVVGGWLDFQAWHANGAFLAFAVNALAVFVAVVAGLAWLARRGMARYVAVGAAAFVIGARIGAWVAPSAHPPDWSPGSVRIDLTVPVAATSSGSAACSTAPNDAVIVLSDGQTIAGDPVWYEVSAPGVDGNPGALSFTLVVDPTGQAESRWDSNTEAEVDPDVPLAHTLAAEGTAASGTVVFGDIPRSRDTPGAGGFGQSGVVTVSGTVTWSCEPPRGVPTPIEGSWFR
jgi:hypothetical protein